tara:strand:- start:16376 stop:16519 length:144 start_codon:yes stop_codon:yes gene_type:complete
MNNTLLAKADAAINTAVISRILPNICFADGRLLNGKGSFLQLPFPAR